MYPSLLLGKDTKLKFPLSQVKKTLAELESWYAQRSADST